jgi:hypothetical protein
MATFTFFDAWKNVSGAGANLSSDTLKLSLCTNNNFPATSAAAASCTIAQCTKVSGGGYADVTCSVTWTGTSTVTLAIAAADPSWTASGTTMTGIQYVVLWDDTIASPNPDPLIGFWDYGSSISLNVGETFTLDLNGSFAAYTLT